MLLEFNVFVVSDDGARPRCSASACGWAIGICFLADGSQKLEPLIVAGTYLEPRVNLFLAEKLTLEHAMTEMQKWMMHHHH